MDTKILGVLPDNESLHGKKYAFILILIPLVSYCTRGVYRGHQGKMRIVWWTFYITHTLIKRELRHKMSWWKIMRRSKGKCLLRMALESGLDIYAVKGCW